jgi:hypothetical protein
MSILLLYAGAAYSQQVDKTMVAKRAIDTLARLGPYLLHPGSRSMPEDLCLITNKALITLNELDGENEVVAVAHRDLRARASSAIEQAGCVPGAP